MNSNDATEQFRTRWRRWLGNKTKHGEPHWVTLLDSTWNGWVEEVRDQCGFDYSPIHLEEVTRENIKARWLVAINHADMNMLRRLDGIYAAEKLGL